MNKALLFKEWIKTRWMFLLMFVVFILAMGYIDDSRNSRLHTPID